MFFRYLKQNLKIKTFAVLIPVVTALTAMLMLAYLRFKASFGWSLSDLVAVFCWNIFAYKDIGSRLDHPFDSPPPDNTG